MEQELIKNYKFISQGYIWYIYYQNGKYLKVLKPSYLKHQQNYLNQLHKLKEVSYHLKWMPNIFEIYQNKSENFFAYSIEEKKGQHLITYMQNSSNPQKSFYNIAKELNLILKEAKQYQIVFTDLITPGNILYDANNNFLNIIDIDSFQVETYSNHYLNKNIYLNNFFNYIILNQSKYHHNFQFTQELNILYFYELFLNLCFKKSMFSITCSRNFSLRTMTREEIKRDVEKNRFAIEKKLLKLLKQLHINSKSNLHQHFLNLLNPKFSNTIDLKDFEIGTEKSQNTSHFRILK